MELFKAQEISLSYYIFRTGIRRITIKDIENINILLTRYPGRFPASVNFINEHMRFVDSREYYHYFVRVHNAAAFIIYHQLAGPKGKRKDFGSLIQRLNDVVDINVSHLENISKRYRRNARRDFLLY